MPCNPPARRHAEPLLSPRVPRAVGRSTATIITGAAILAAAAAPLAVDLTPATNDDVVPARPSSAVGARLPPPPESLAHCSGRLPSGEVGERSTEVWGRQSIIQSRSARRL